MTVAIGMVCADGVIVASDSQTTSGQTASHGDKVHIVANAKAVWTAAGSVYTIEEVAATFDQRISPLLVSNEDESVRSAFELPDHSNLRGNVADSIRVAMADAYNSIMPGFAPVASMQPQHPFAAAFLLLGVGQEGNFFLEIGADGQLNWHHDRGFYAVGSGGSFATVAMSLMAHYFEGKSVPLRLGQQLAYRVIETTCEVSAGLVSLPVQMAVADEHGARILDDDELRTIEDQVDAWKELERNTLFSAEDDVRYVEQLPSIS